MTEQGKSRAKAIGTLVRTHPSQSAITAFFAVLTLYFLLTILAVGHAYEFGPADMGIAEGESVYFTRIEDVWVRRGIYRLEADYSTEGTSVIALHLGDLLARNNYVTLPVGEEVTHSEYFYMDSPKGVVAIGVEGGESNFHPVRIRLTYLKLITLGYHLEHTFLPFALILLAVWCCFPQWVRALTFRGWYFLPSLLFSVTCFLCRMTEYAVDVSFAEYVKVHPLDTAWSLFIYYLLFLSLAVLAEDLVERFRHRQESGTAGESSAAPGTSLSAKLTGRFLQAPFRMSALILLLSWLPAVIFACPGIPLRADTAEQIGEALGLRPLANAHPLAHTMLFRLWLSIGNALGSYNLGLFLFCLCQVAVLLCICSFSISVLVRSGRVPSALWICLLLWYAFHPRIRAFLMMMTKDVYYAAFLLLFVTALFELRMQGLHAKTLLLFLIAAAGTVLFRQEGIFIVFLSVLALPTAKWYRRALCAGIVALLLFALLLPVRFLSVTGRAWVLFLLTPYQQTARYVTYFPEEVTPEEREDIGAVLDYERIPARYNPRQGDGIAATVLTFEAEPRYRYLGAWRSMFFKHPEVYLKAFLYNKGRCFYPVTMFYNNYIHDGGVAIVELNHPDDVIRGGSSYSFINDEFFGGEAVLGFPAATEGVRTALEYFRETILALPVVECLALTPLYLWGLFLWLFIVCKQKERKGSLVLLMPLLAQTLIRLTDSCNGDYLRYSFPFILTLPATILFGLMWMERFDNLSPAIHPQKLP